MADIETSENQETPAEEQTPLASNSDESVDAPASEDVEAEKAPEQMVEQLTAQVEQANDQVLRAQAELENFRKRTRRDMEDERRYASLPLMRDLLAVVDNMQLALDAAEKSDGAAGLLEGVKMVVDQFTSALSQHDCVRIEGVGSPFDPNHHEAIGQEPTDEFPPNSVAREMRVGYMLHDRVIRPSQVFVSIAPTAAEESDSEASKDDSD